MQLAHPQYVMYSQLTEGGVTVSDAPELVGAGFIENFCSPRTLAWFRNLGGTEEVTGLRGKGDITVHSTRPDGEAVRLVVFTPVRHYFLRATNDPTRSECGGPGLVRTLDTNVNCPVCLSRLG